MKPRMCLFMPLEHFTEGEGTISHSAGKHLVLLCAPQLFLVGRPHLGLAKPGMCYHRHFNFMLLTTIINEQGVNLGFSGGLFQSYILIFLDPSSFWTTICLSRLCVIDKRNRIFREFLSH